MKSQLKSRGVMMPRERENWPGISLTSCTRNAGRTENLSVTRFYTDLYRSLLLSYASKNALKISHFIDFLIFFPLI